jgi:hypothetical protein
MAGDVKQVVFDWLATPANKREKTPRQMQEYLHIQRSTWRGYVEEYRETNPVPVAELTDEDEDFVNRIADGTDFFKFDVKKFLKENVEAVTREFVSKCIDDCKPDHLKLFYQLTGIMEEKSESSINLGDLARAFSEVAQEMEKKKSQSQQLTKQKSGLDVDLTQNTSQETTSISKTEPEQPQSGLNPGNIS